MDSFGALRAAASRSARGLMVGGGIIVAIFGALLAWNLVGRGGQRGLIGAAIVALVAIPAVVVYLKSPKRVGAYEGGLVLEPYFGRAARSPGPTSSTVASGSRRSASSRRSSACARPMATR